jgi:hypothetical protein
VRERFYLAILVQADPVAASLIVAFPRSGRLRSGRFDLLPPLESLFFAGPKKSNPKKWPLKLAASC